MWERESGVSAPRGALVPALAEASGRVTDQFPLIAVPMYSLRERIPQLPGSREMATRHTERGFGILILKDRLYCHLMGAHRCPPPVPAKNGLAG